MLLKSSGQLGGLPRRFKLTAQPCWRNQWRSQLIGTGYLDTTWSRIRMVGRQRAAPCKCIGSNSLSRAESDAGWGLSAPIVHRITELNSPTRAIGRNMNGGRIGNNYRCTARQPLNGCGTHRHINFRDLELCRRTLPCWRNQWRSQLIGAGHLDTTWPRVGMIDRQRATPGKCVGFRRLSWIEVDTGRRLSTPIVDRIRKLNSTANAIRPDVDERCIGHGQVRTAGS